MIMNLCPGDRELIDLDARLGEKIDRERIMEVREHDDPFYARGDQGLRTTVSDPGAGVSEGVPRRVLHTAARGIVSDPPRALRSPVQRVVVP